MRIALILLSILALAACRTSDGVFDRGPQLISEVTLPPVTFAPTRAFSPTPPPTDTEPPDLPTDAPTQVTATADQFVLITPTLPPSKTPTITPTITPTPLSTSTPRPTLAMAVSEPILVPTMVYVTAPPVEVAQAPDPSRATTSGELSLPLPGVPDAPAASCTIPWFFFNPRLPDCPLNSPMQSSAAYQNFQYGAMIWIGAQDAIYVLYDSDTLPRWEVYQDNYEEGMPDSDPSLDSQAPAYADWQPRRGFGLVWRDQPGVRQRIGWAESPYEQAYEAVLQTRTDGTIFLREPNGRVFALTAGRDWRMYD